MFEYWIGQNVNYEHLWNSYDEGRDYIIKYKSMRVHMIRITLEQQPAGLPLFNFEVVFKTIKGYFHDLKHLCLSNREYQEAGPLFLYCVDRSSGRWEFLSELRQLVLLGTTLADEKTIGQKLDNLDKRMDFLKKHFGNAVSPQDFQMFMKAKSPRQLERAVQRLIEQGIKKVEISSDPFLGNAEQTRSTMIDIKRVLDDADHDVDDES